MKKQEKFVKIFELSVSKILFDFVNNEVLKGTNISSKRFWNGFNKAANQLAPINNKLIHDVYSLVFLSFIDILLSLPDNNLSMFFLCVNITNIEMKIEK